MAVSPKDNEELALAIREIYERAELEILIMIMERLRDGINAPMWQTQKLAQVEQLRRDIEKTLGSVNKEIPSLIQELLETAYLSGAESSVSDLKEAIDIILERGGDPANSEQLRLALFEDGEVPDNFNWAKDVTTSTMIGVNAEAITALAAATTQTIASTHLPIVRQSLDIYRSVITEVASDTLIGHRTRLEIAQQALNRFAGNGISGFTDKAGRNWNIASYTEMATRTTVGQAALQGHSDQMEHFGLDLVVISDHARECELCRPWEGKVFSLSGTSKKYPPLQKAIDGKLFHPQCSHRKKVYIENVTKIPKKTKTPEQYEDQKRQREIERNIRKWKKRAAIAMDDAERKKANAKVRAWQEEMRNHLEANPDLPRKRNRERLNTAR